MKDIVKKLEYLLKSGKLQYEKFTSEEHISHAYDLCLLYINASTWDRRAKQFKTRLSRRSMKRPFLVFYTDSIKQKISQRLEKRAEKIRSEFESEFNPFFEECLIKYPWVRYAVLLPLFTRFAVLALVALPPDYAVTHDIKPSQWIEYFFVIKKGSEPRRRVVSRVFFSNVRLQVSANITLPDGRRVSIVSEKRVVELLSKCRGGDKLIELFRRNVQKYVARGKSTVHARSLAFRDIVRVFLSNTLLVTQYILDSVTLPKELAQMPGNVTSYIDPVEVLPKDIDIEFVNKLLGFDIREVTWRWAVKKVLNL
jgi:hypothetical protein